MNERIKLLAKEAGYEIDMFGIGHWDMPECKKFAELMIQDCIQTLRNNGYDDAAKCLHDVHIGMDDHV
jgi:peptidoglycan/xylan/chitin deacetylase (PgdA/CDA1 family)